MRKILKNKVYDTDTAKKVAEYDSDYPKNDFNWYREELYLKKTGEYFLYGQGYAASPYAEYITSVSAYGAGEKIIPLTYEEARTWAEESLEAEEYEEIFGKVSEDDDIYRFTCRIPSSTNHKLDQEVQRTGKSKLDIVTEALEEYLK